jgi:carbon-monoxide dehydrogenase small subunit
VRLLHAGVPARRRGAAPSERQVREALAGNLCRCTGYEGIVAAVRSLARAEGDAR